MFNASKCKKSVFFALCVMLAFVYSHAMRREGQENLFSGVVNALHVGNFARARALIARIAPGHINSVDRRGWTLLHFAALYLSRDVAQALLMHGIDKNRRNDEDQTAADIAVDLRDNDLADYIDSFQKEE